MMNSLIALALAVSSFGGSLLAADDVRNRIGSPVPGYSASLPVSDEVPLWSFPSGSSNVDYEWARSGYNVMDGFDADGASYDAFFDWNYLYIPTYLNIDISAYDGSFVVKRVIWERCTFATSSYALGLSGSVPYALGLFNPSTNYYYSYEFHNVVLSYTASNMSMGAQSYDYDGSLLCQRKVTVWNTTGSGPYSLSVTASAIAPLINDIAATYIKLYQSSASVYYRDGHDVGYAEGYQAGKIDGYNEGLDQADAPAGLITSLFGSLVNIPISVINGLTPLAIWNTPIISLVLTFVAIGAVLFIVKRLI